MKRLPWVALVALLVFAGACAGGDQTEPNAAAFQADDQACDGQENVDTLELTITPVVDSVVPGNAATYRARVVRRVDLSADLVAALKKDRRNTDLTTEQPVEDVSVGFSAAMPGLPAWGTGVTDADGTTTLRVKVRRDAPAGVYDADGMAFRSVAEGPCAHVSEEGSWHGEAALTIR